MLSHSGNGSISKYEPLEPAAAQWELGRILNLVVVSFLYLTSFCNCTPPLGKFIVFS